MKTKNKQIIFEFSGGAFLSTFLMYLDSNHDDLPSLIFAFVPFIFVASYKVIDLLAAFFNFHSTGQYRASKTLQNKINLCKEQLENQHLNDRTRRHLQNEINETTLALVEITPGSKSIDS